VIEAVAPHNQRGHTAENASLGVPGRSPEKDANPQRTHLRLLTHPVPDPQRLHGTLSESCYIRFRLSEERARRDC